MAAARHLGAGGAHLRLDQRQRQVAVAEQLAARALLEVEPVRRPQHPRTQLRDAVLARGLVPIAPLARARPVGPLHELERDAAHDELGRRRREARVAPPAEPALDVGVVAALGLVVAQLREHPRAEKAGLKALARPRAEQRPRGDVHGEAAAEVKRDAFLRHAEVAMHLAGLGGGGLRVLGEGWCDQREDCKCKRGDATAQVDVH